ncbi:MAG: TVP38/TMEM64 family protein [Deltaproteobacteria bacterium]|nr:TVP38/TMEM64 family protein [Deltaproteobacteria bacterium]
MIAAPTTSPKPPQAPRKRPMGSIILGLTGLVALAVLLIIYWHPLWHLTQQLWEILQDREAFRARIESYGVWAPVVFVIFQIFQVLVSPIPGELVGAAGGYVFGWFPSLLYSTIGLSVGSWINFFAARLLGRALVERFVPAKYLAKISFLMERQGVIASFIFFIIPGFPKDYFCFALGLTPMSWRIFLVVSSVGRIPGTLMLSLQGSAIYNENYWSFLILGLLSLAFIAPVYFWRERIYQLLYRLDKNRGPLNGDGDDDSSSAEPPEA